MICLYHVEKKHCNCMIWNSVCTMLALLNKFLYGPEACRISDLNVEIDLKQLKIIDN